MHRLFRGLDWETPVSRIKFADHWRLWVCVGLGAVLATSLWNLFFPHTFWFFKLWTGFATGGVVAMIPGTFWQLRDENRSGTTSGRLIVLASSVWGTFAVLSLFFWGPQLYGEEQERSLLRTLAENDLAAISVRFPDGRFQRVKDAPSISSFVALSKRAELFYPSQEASAFEFQMTIDRTDGTSLTYSGRVPERHSEDISLSFRAHVAWTEIIVPGGRRWLDQFSSQK